MGGQGFVSVGMCAAWGMCVSVEQVGVSVYMSACRALSDRVCVTAVFHCCPSP